jgi:FkbM family methyltransferase
MNINKIINYFILRPLNEIIIILSKFFSGKSFTVIYNLLSFISFNNKYIKFQNGCFHVMDNKKKWFFSHKTRAWIYFKGLKHRNIELSTEYLMHKVPIKKNDIIIDCGANVGDFYLCFDKKIRYIGIEPSPKEFFALKKNIKNQTLINKALWKEQGKKTFYVSSEDADSSLIEINKYEKKLKVDTITLDNILKKNNQRIKLLKLEAEGAEPEILEGCKKINLIDYITIDAGFERGKLLESTLVSCINYLNKKNFELIGYSNTRVVILFKNENIKK